MPKYNIEGDTAEIGWIKIDWKTRKLEINGAAGYETGSVSIDELRTVFNAEHDESVQVFPFIAWRSNADGELQIEIDESLNRIEDALEENEEQQHSV